MIEEDFGVGPFCHCILISPFITILQDQVVFRIRSTSGLDWTRLGVQGSVSLPNYNYRRHDCVCVTKIR